MPYTCPKCGRLHLYSSECLHTNNYTTGTQEYIPWVAQPVVTLPATIESRLDRIIDLLEQLLIKGAK